MRERGVVDATDSGSVPVGTSTFCRTSGTDSEYAYKRRCMDTGEVMYHAHIGLGTWKATATALREVTDQLAERGHRLDRFGLCLDRGMSVPESERQRYSQETGPRLAGDEWNAVGRDARAQPHLGDFMIGTAASYENTRHALDAGITTIGNLGQFFTFDVPGGSSGEEVTAATLRALQTMSSARAHGAVVHSYLDDGPAMQFANYGNYLGWAALETDIVENMIGARLAHCYGGLVPQPKARAFLNMALRHLHEDSAVGSMVYGNTVDYTRDRYRNQAVLHTYLLVDIATQLRAPSGHAVNPVPLTENIRIPNAEEILEVQLLAREVEREARRSADLFDWRSIETDAARTVAYAWRVARRIKDCLAEDGADVTNPRSLLSALRGVEVPELERRLGLPPPDGLARLEPWKAGTARALVSDVTRGASVSLRGVRAVIASLDVHDLMRDVLMRSLMALGAEVVVMPNDSRPEAVASAAVAEDVDAVIVSTYNGAALTQGKQLAAALSTVGFDGAALIGGVLNEDTGSGVPVPVNDELCTLGLVCVDDITEVPALLGSAPETLQ